MIAMYVNLLELAWSLNYYSTNSLILKPLLSSMRLWSLT